MQELGFPEGAKASIWDSLGYAHHGLADHQQAVICYQRALGLFRGLGDRYNEAVTLTNLGDVHLSAGDSGAARRTWAEALPILEEIDHADASRVRAKLTSHVSPGPDSVRPIPAMAGNSVAHAPGGAISPALSSFTIPATVVLLAACGANQQVLANPAEGFAARLEQLVLPDGQPNPRCTSYRWLNWQLRQDSPDVERPGV
jgi:tetratricopeptide (TPR) repeat protein